MLARNDKQLTERQLSILEHLSMGKTVKEVAYDMNVSIQGVQRSIQHIREKMFRIEGSRLTMPGIVSTAIRRGWIH